MNVKDCLLWVDRWLVDTWWSGSLRAFSREIKGRFCPCSWARIVSVSLLGERMILSQTKSKDGRCAPAGRRKWNSIPIYHFQKHHNLIDNNLNIWRILVHLCICLYTHTYEHIFIYIRNFYGLVTESISNLIQLLATTIQIKKKPAIWNNFLYFPHFVRRKYLINKEEVGKQASFVLSLFSFSPTSQTPNNKLFQLAHLRHNFWEPALFWVFSWSVRSASAACH